MKSIFPVAALLLAFTVKQAIPQTPQPVPPANTGVIEGIVTRAGTPEPIASVYIELDTTQAVRGAGNPTGQTMLDALTDEAGHFIFKDLYPGRYQLRYSIDGYFALPDGIHANGVPVPQSVNNGARGAAFTPVFMLDVKQPYKLAIQVVPGGVISGRVSDSNGRPIVRGQIAALRIAYQFGQRTLASVKTATTNDRGEYRLFGLEPGEYYVRSEYRRSSTAVGGGEDTFRAYFPGVDDPGSAAPTMVRNGAESSGTNITIRPTTTVTVSGTVVVPDSVMPPQAPIPLGTNVGTPMVGAASASQFYLISPDATGLRDDASAFQNSLNFAADRSSGKFEIRNVRPGRYEIYTIVSTNPADAQERRAGRASISVGNQDLTGVIITVLSGVDLKARFTSADTAVQSQFPTQLTLRPADGKPAAIQQISQAGARGARGARGGSSENWWVYSGLTEGRYVLDSPLQSLRDAYVADIRQGDRSIYETGIIVIGSAVPDPVEVILARPAGTIEGTVQNAEGKPAQGMYVLLIPNGDRRTNLMLYKRATSDADGKVTLRGLAPGPYKLFAWQSNPGGGEQNAEFMKGYEDRGIPVTIEPGAQLKLQIPVIPAGKP